MLERGRRVRERSHGEERRRRDSRADQAPEPRHDDDPDARPGHDDDDHAAAGLRRRRRPATRPRQDSSRPICGHTKGVSRRETPFASKVRTTFPQARPRKPIARQRTRSCRYGSGTCGTDTTPSRSRIASLSSRRSRLPADGRHRAQRRRSSAPCRATRRPASPTARRSRPRSPSRSCALPGAR